ncbi:paired amphipathic helix protein Sin3-like 4 [Capsella rubella]|uniref:paired amphipathic helix protein Sin3-like 4 n=1 Tax=Capsella rubella TaxID=81985 RepID=UPI000CD4E06F|nr:paired amphipathic helix protein Sin3-like 4 [Capsella rubella]
MKMTEDIDELLKMTEILSNPLEQTTIRTLAEHFRFGIIGKTEYESALCRLKDRIRDRKTGEEKKPEENPIHHDPKARVGPRIKFKLCSNPKEDVTTHHGLRKIDAERDVKENLTDLLMAIEERLTTKEMRLYTDLCKSFESRVIDYGDFVSCVLTLIGKHKSLYQRFTCFSYGDKGSKVDEVGETGQHDEDSLVGTCPESRVEVDEKKNLEGKNKKRVLFPPKEWNLPLKKRKMSTSEQATEDYKSYTLIPEEEQSPVSDPVLNNTCAVGADFIQASKKVSRIEQEMYKCEDEMFEIDMLVGSLTSAVDSAERVMSGEMNINDLGVKFYRCIEKIYGDKEVNSIMIEKVKDDHQRALPTVLARLKQKLSEITDIRESKKGDWKKTWKRLSAKQKRSNAPHKHLKKRR